MTTAPSLPLLIAAWLDARLQEAFVPHSALSRLYLVDVLDPEALDRLEAGAARLRLVGEHHEARALEGMAAAADLAEADAAAVVATRWLPRPAGGPLRPGGFGARRRARLLQVATGEGVGVVARFDDDPHLVLLRAA